MLGEIFVDLFMSGNGLGNARLGIGVPIVSRSVANQDTSQLFETLDQLNALHGTVNSSTLRTPGI